MSTGTAFTYDEAMLNALEHTLSASRLRPYLGKSSNDKGKALELYVWNTQVSEALFNPLRGLEVAMRNSIDVQLTAEYGESWYEKESLFLSDQVEKIKKVKQQFDKKRELTKPDIVAGLSFGFWVDILYHTMYDELWRKSLCKAFPNRPQGTMRKHVGSKVENLRQLRNRIAHHEPIFSRPLEYEYGEVLAVTEWICPQTSRWIKHHNRFEEVMKLRPF
jgi:abortive infection bacteriophage resistance protein